MTHVPGTADQYKMLHCHSQYDGKWQLWTKFWTISWLSSPPPPGNAVSMTDLTLAALWHICLIACIWFTHSLWHIWMFHPSSYREKPVKGGNRFVRGFWLSLCIDACVNRRLCERFWCAIWMQYVHSLFFLFFCQFSFCLSMYLSATRWNKL